MPTVGACRSTKLNGMVGRCLTSNRVEPLFWLSISYNCNTSMEPMVSQ